MSEAKNPKQDINADEIEVLGETLVMKPITEKDTSNSIEEKKTTPVEDNIEVLGETLVMSPITEPENQKVQPLDQPKANQAETNTEVLGETLVMPQVTEPVTPSVAEKKVVEEPKKETPKPEPVASDDDKKKNWKYRLVLVFIIFLFAFVLFLPQITSFIAKWTNRSQEPLLNEAKKSGYYLCNFERQLADGTLQETYKTYYEEDTLTKISATETTTLISDPIVTNLQQLQMQCESYREALGEETQVECDLTDTTQETKVVYNFTKVDFTQFDQNFVEMNGMYFDYTSQTKIADVVADFEEGGYTCQVVK